MISLCQELFQCGRRRFGIRKLKNAAVKQIADDWKHFSIYDKATAAVLLHALKVMRDMPA